MSVRNRQALVRQDNSTTRLDRWLGEDELAALRPINLTNFMVENLPTEEIANITVNNLCIYGKRELDLMLKQLPPDHKLQPPRKLFPKVLTQLPWFGLCRIGMIPLLEENGKMLANQIYIANFVSDIDAKSKDMFKFSNEQRSSMSTGARMIFGVNVILDAYTLGQLKRHEASGDFGLTFKATSRADALREIVEVSRLSTKAELKAKFSRVDAAKAVERLPVNPPFQAEDFTPIRAGR